ncbi:ABC transporter permease [Cryobacterium sp. Y50]|uniref:ABC transporter permease n=1 Tax=Cryobacterium sp. Y50 TaxID=2048286 RepID=UPI000CE537E9|nr:ABC transporter permease [Cryobacterium sp. Y50]
MTETMLRERTKHRSSFSGTVRGEMIKAGHSRSLVLLAWFAVVLSAVTAYGYAVVGAESGQEPVAVVDDIVRAWMMVFLFSGVFAAMYVAREFDSRVINRTVLLAGTRQSVLASKLLVTVFFGACFGVLAAVGGAVSAVILPLVLDEHPAWSTEATWTLVGVVMCCVLSALWGAGLGLAVRNQLTAILMVVGLTLLVDPGLQQIWPEASNGLFTIALSSLYLDPKPELLPVPFAALIAVAWITAAIAFGGSRFLRKDLP